MTDADHSLLPQCPTRGPAAESRWAVVGCFILLLIALHVVVGPYVRLSEWRVNGDANTNFAEALAWREGRLDLPHRVHDSALRAGRVYSVNPPLFSFLSVAALVLG